VAKLYCPCGEGQEFWGEFWFDGGRYQWCFFDHDQRSETFGERIENCPACGSVLERKNLGTPRPFRS
jgi:hypothetical protein